MFLKTIFKRYRFLNRIKNIRHTEIFNFPLTNYNEIDQTFNII